MLKNNINQEANKVEKKEIERYSRQMMLPDIGLKGQNSLKSAKVLVIGAGGIGSSSLLYLASAGVGTIGICDADLVDESNLHRQVIHSQDKIGMKKVESAKERMLGINPNIIVTTHPIRIDATNAQEIVSQYDLILDGCDNALTRYITNDACVLEKKVLISGAAVKWDGQITIYNKGDGPCYRCLYPDCPQASQMQSCAESGVLGMVPGLIGVMMAIECIKLICRAGEVLSERLVVFDAKKSFFRNCKIRGRKDTCIACGPKSSITACSDYDYDAFVGAKCDVPAYENIKHIKWVEMLEIIKPKDVILDVRPSEQHSIFNFTEDNKNIKHIPMDDLKDLNIEEVMDILDINEQSNVFIFCRKGNASRAAAYHLDDIGLENAYNVRGGLVEYQNSVDPSVVTLV